MMTSTWDRHKAAFTGCEFEPFHVWVLPLEEEESCQSQREGSSSRTQDNSSRTQGCKVQREASRQSRPSAQVMLEIVGEIYCNESQHTYADVC